MKFHEISSLEISNPNFRHGILPLRVRDLRAQLHAATWVPVLARLRRGGLGRGRASHFGGGGGRRPWGLVDERWFAGVSSDRRWVVAIIYLSYLKIVVVVVEDTCTTSVRLKISNAPHSAHSTLWMGFQEW